ncbi:FAD-dependent oxidoreductase [Microbulbifer sp. ZKSA002]|uniref:FAD-dependent oxidoreductase n=1 Tax=Microbulbifer sp. ZKSA002 TaxID=3243388 RepID=UPI0040397072
MSHIDWVLVVGAGPTGLAAACALSFYGIKCRIVERRTKPSELSRAVGIFPCTIRRLLKVGVSDNLVSEAMRLCKVQYLQAGRPLLFLDNRGDAYKEYVGFGLPQNRTEEILRDALLEQGVSVEYGVAATEVDSSDHRVVVTLSDGSVECFDWLIAADGVHSTIREKLSIPFSGTDLPEPWGVADVDIEGECDPDLVSVDIQRPGNQFTISLPMGKQRLRVVATQPDALGALDVSLKIKNIHRSGSFQISIRQAKSYRSQRVLLVGDAAHCHSPVGGKGMNLGIADAIAAVDAIINGTVDSYSDERRKIGAATIRKTEIVRRIISSNSLLNKILVRMLAKLAVSFPVVRQAYTQNLTKL